MNWIAAIIVAILLFFAYPVAQANDDRGCSARSIAGAWGFKVEGTRLGVGQVAGVGVFRLLRDGTIVHGSQAVSLGGAIASETFRGTFSISSDCTGQAAIDVDSPVAPRRVTLAIVVVEGSRKLLMSFADQGNITIVEARRIRKEER